MNEQIMADSPDGIPGAEVYADGFLCSTDFTRTQGINRPWGYGSLPRATIIYHALNLRRHADENAPVPFAYV